MPLAIQLYFIFLAYFRSLEKMISYYSCTRLFFTLQIKISHTNKLMIATFSRYTRSLNTKCDKIYVISCNLRDTGKRYIANLSVKKFHLKNK